MKLIFATHNANKKAEIQQLLGDDYELLSLEDLSYYQDIPETANTLEGNSKIKVDLVYDYFNLPCIADDTGLEVEILGGEPGVYSARYAGEEKNTQKNMDLLLNKLKGIDNRRARFRTIISYKTKNEIHQFEGIVEGEIINRKIGTNGFGYDPIFMPEGSKKTFAQMSLEEKNSYSHRSIAFNKFKNYLINSSS